MGGFTDAAFGTTTGSQLTINIAAPPDTLTMTSGDIPSAELGLPRSLNFAFTSLTPPLHTTGNILGDTIAGFSASFSGNASAAAVVVPEPRVAGGAVLLAMGILLLYRRFCRR